MPLSEHVYCVAVTFRMTEYSNEYASKFALSLNVPLQKLPGWFRRPQLSNHPGDSAPYSPDLVPCDFWLFPKLKSPWKGKRFQTFNEIQENPTGQLMATRRTVWGPKVPTLKGAEASLSYVQRFLYLVSSSRNVSIFHIAWAGYFLDRPCVAIITNKYLYVSVITIPFS